MFSLRLMLIALQVIPLARHGASRRSTMQATAPVDYGFLRINVADGRIGYQFVDESGRVLDHVDRPL